LLVGYALFGGTVGRKIDGHGCQPRTAELPVNRREGLYGFSDHGRYGSAEQRLLKVVLDD
jgi:hypothetical protein